jgi:hypothetical protein
VQPGDRRRVAAVADHLLEHRDQRGTARDEHLDPGQVVDERCRRAEILEAQPRGQIMCSAPKQIPARPSGSRGAAAASRGGGGHASRSPRQSSITRITSRNCSSATLGTNAKRSSPAASSRARRSASRLSVLTRSPEARRTMPAATTRTSIAIDRGARQTEPRRPRLIDRVHRTRQRREDSTTWPGGIRSRTPRNSPPVWARKIGFLILRVGALTPKGYKGHLLRRQLRAEMEPVGLGGRAL